MNYVILNEDGLNRAEFPSLYKRAKNGKITEWTLWVEDNSDKNCPVICRENGYIDGKRNVKKRYVRKGTNVGRANEKTPFAHSLFLAENYWKDQIEQNFVDDLERVDDPPKYIYPMLAKTYDEKKHGKKTYIAQPKFNGARCFQKPEGTDMWSRKLKIFENINHIRGACYDLRKQYPNSFIPDGEIYTHGEDFQDIMSWLKRLQADTEKLEYWIYDLAIPNVGCLDRLKMLDEMVPDHHAYLKKVPYWIVTGHDEIVAKHNECIANGYEGLILREIDGEYGFNERDDRLLKFKYFFDDEFIIVGANYEEWDDTTNGVVRKIVVWECETEDGHRFTSRPVGKMIDREQMYKDRDQYIGKLLTVRYQELSQDGVPIFNTGRAIRDYE